MYCTIHKALSFISVRSKFILERVYLWFSPGYKLFNCLYTQPQVGLYYSFLIIFEDGKELVIFSWVYGAQLSVETATNRLLYSSNFGAWQLNDICGFIIFLDGDNCGSTY